MTTVVIIALVIVAVVVYFAMLSDELDPLAAMPLITLCTLASIVAHRTTWWLGVISWVGTIIIVLAMFLAYDCLWWMNLRYDWSMWTIHRTRERQRKKDKKLGSCS